MSTPTDERLTETFRDDAREYAWDPTMLTKEQAEAAVRFMRAQGGEPTPEGGLDVEWVDGEYQAKGAE